MFKKGDTVQRINDPQRIAKVGAVHGDYEYDKEHYPQGYHSFTFKAESGMLLSIRDWQLYIKKAINTTTQEEHNTVLTILRRRQYLEKNSMEKKKENWKIYENQTAINEINIHEFSNIEYYKKEKYKIIPASEFIKDNT